MSGILKRTVYVDSSKGYILWHDWARVSTSIGNMVEPRCALAMRPIDGVSVGAAKMNPTDDIFRVDALEHIEMGKEKRFLSEEEALALHGGGLWQRVGY